MQELKYQKVYVPIILFIDENGKKTPKKIKWIDGNKYTIDKIVLIKIKTIKQLYIYINLNHPTFGNFIFYIYIR